MPPPNITKDQIQALFPKIVVLGNAISGGQKLVFPCTIDGERFVLKVMASNTKAAPAGAADQTEDVPLADEVLARARREVAILEACKSLHLPKIGPMGLTVSEFQGQQLIAFSEEFIDGENLETILANTPTLGPPEILSLAQHMNIAIDELWKHRKIHRDIKPPNIMKRRGDGSFVLLDAGIALDLEGGTLTKTGIIVRTPGFIAPELITYDSDGKRKADCRSDHFLLGIVLYLTATGQHPFITKQGQGEDQTVANIIKLKPQPPHTMRKDIPKGLSKIIMRMLEKRSHARFKNCAQLKAHLDSCDLGRRK